MSTSIVLEDGRTLGVSNGQFDGILEAVAAELGSCELTSWLLGQRCQVRGPGVGCLDLRELSPAARERFRAASRRIHADHVSDPSSHDAWLVDPFSELSETWERIEKGEAPESHSSPAWRIHPASGERRGPGW